MRLPSRLISTICGPPFNGCAGLLGCAARPTMPPSLSELTFFGLNGSVTSYWMNSPVPQHETYRYRSSTDRLMSVTSGATALKPFRNGGSFSGSAGSAGISITFLIAQPADPFAPFLLVSRYQTQIDDDKSLSDTTTPANPYARDGSCAGRNSRTICCSSPSASSCTWRRWRRSHTCSLLPYFP